MQKNFVSKRLSKHLAASMPWELMEARSYLAAHVVGSTTNYTTIQAAVNAAVAGGIVTVDAGTYAEQVTVNKLLTIRGAKTGVDARTRSTAGESIVTGGTSGTTKTASFIISASDVTIDGFTVQGETDKSVTVGAAIVMKPGVAGTKILNNIVQNNVAGVFLVNSSATDPAVFKNNLFQNNNNAGVNGGRGIYTDGSLTNGLLTNVLIDGNTFINNRGGSGTTGLEAAVAFEAGTAGKQTNITITNNTFTNNGKCVLFFNTTGVLLQGNTAQGAADWYSGSFRFEGNNHDVRIQYNNIINNPGPGVAVDSNGTPGDNSDFFVNNNNISNNGTNSTYSNRLGVVYNQSVYDGMFDARNNYWGNASGPSGDGPGTGDGVYGNASKTGNWIFAKGGSELFSPWSTSSISITAIPLPAAPAQLSVGVNSSSSVTLTWTSPRGTAAYQCIQRSTDGVNFVAVGKVAPLVNTFTDTGLISGTTYVYRIVATNSTGSATSNTASTAPVTPAGLAASAISASSIKLTWLAGATTPTSYTLERSVNGSSFATIATAIAGSATSYTDATGLAASSTYYYRLTAVTPTGTSPASNIASATTLSSSATTTQLSSLAWTSATSGYLTPQKNKSIVGNTLKLRGVSYASGIGTHAASTITYNLAGKYDVFKSDVGVDDEVSTTSGAAVRFQVYGDGVLLFDSGVVNRSTAAINVAVSVAGVQTLTLVANNGVANNIDYDHADWAGAALIANPTAPAAPTSLLATAAGSNSVVLAWTATGSNQTGFKLDRSTDGTTWSTIAAPTATTYIDTGLTAGVTYSYRVRAINLAGESPNSSVASATPSQLVSTYLADLSWTSATSGYLTVQKNTSIKGNPLKLRGVTYAKGLGTHAASTITYNLNGKYTTFVSDVGVDDEENGVGIGSVIFQVIGDGQVLFDSGVVTNNDPTVSITVSVTGVNTLQLVATNAVTGSIDYDHADWAGARLLANAQAPAAPTNLTAAAVSSSSIKLNWIGNGSDLTGFKIERSIDSTTWSPVATVAASVLTYTDTGLSALTAYSYRLRATNSVGDSVNSSIVSATTLSTTSVTTALSSLNWTSATAGYGTVQKDATVKGNTITLNGVTYASGIGTHAVSQITYNLAGGYKNFLSDIGVDDEVNAGGTGSVVFQVMGDGVLLYDSGVLTNGMPPSSLNIDVTGVQTLTLIATTAPGGDIDFAHADWAGARLIS